MNSEHEPLRREPLEAALLYAEKGWPVLPVVSKGKKPLVPKGLHDASTDPELIRSWWEAWPEANVAIRTGTASGVFAVDIDSLPDGSAPRTPDEVAAELGIHIEQTLVARTPSGGHHLLMQLPEGEVAASPVKKIAPDLDIRAENAYIVVEPSDLPAGRYTWSQQYGLGDPNRWSEVTTAPVGLLERLRELRRRETYSRPGGAWQVLLTGAEEGERNVRLFAFASSLRALNTPREVAEGLLSAANEKCRPVPLPEQELQSLLDSAWRYTPSSSSSPRDWVGWKEGGVDTSSSSTSNPNGEQKKLVFMTARELVEKTESYDTWTVEGMVGPGLVTLLSGQSKAAGKTTFALALIQAVLKAESFIDQETERTRVVYLSEQSPRCFRTAVERAGLLGSEDLVVATWTPGVDWETAIAQAGELCAEESADLLVIDTFAQFAGLRGDDENNAGMVQRRMDTLAGVVREHDLAVLLIVHDRKSGGDVGSAVRGSGALVASVDIVFQLSRTSESGSPVRHLRSLGRYSDETPDGILVRYDGEGGFQNLGSSDALVRLEATARLEEVLPKTAEEAVGMSELEEQIGVSKSTLSRALSAMKEEGVVSREKRGKRFVYWLSPEQAAVVN